MNLQPQLENEIIRLQPLQESDFEALYAVAADPLIWAQHPNPNRYQREVFANYFRGAVLSAGAFLVLNAQTGELIGSTRFYDYDAAAQTVIIGYTFLARSHWGGRWNPAMKRLMLDYAFRQGVQRVLFHVWAQNRRSQIAMERLGAVKVGELDVPYFGEPSKLNWVYEITSAQWSGRRVDD
jgi:RimJ/RimL family protein N-acetyltransferase